MVSPEFLRTLAMDAWASLSHYLDYKNESDVPRELRKDFFALSGLFYVADTHFEIFYAERQKSKEIAKQSVSEIPTVGQELNLDTLSAYLRKRYPNRKSAGLVVVSQLVGELVHAGYTTLDRLHKALDASADAFELFEKKHPPSGKKFLDSGVVRISLAILDPVYAESIYSEEDEVNDFRQFVKTS